MTTRRDVVCSTPCGITEVITSGRRPDRASALVRCSTPCGITEVITSVAVESTPRGIRCSTPGGITEVITVGQSGGLGLNLGSSVLNALRHHGGHHPNGVVRGRDAWVRCSTPCGITEVITGPAAAWTDSGRPCAQRLAASRRSSRVGSWNHRSSSTPRVLNALRHHGGHHRSRYRPSRNRAPASDVLNALRHHGGHHAHRDCCPTWIRRSPGAQRLAASRRSSLRPGRAVVGESGPS